MAMLPCSDDAPLQGHLAQQATILSAFFASHPAKDRNP
jgi:hypothetical protein